MVTIRFIEDAVVETADHGRVKIAKETVQENVTEATAERWIRRGKAVRVPSMIERAAAAPVPPAPPSPEELAEAEERARREADDQTKGKTAATPYVPGVAVGEGEGKTEVAAPATPKTAKGGKVTGGRVDENPLG